MSQTKPTTDLMADGDPFPILDPEQYRFLHYAVELVETLGSQLADDGRRRTGPKPEDVVQCRLARLRRALSLFEEFPPSAENGEGTE